MADWIDELAAALGEPPIGPDERNRLLRTSREVAHRVERRFTPLAAFLMGAAVARRGGGTGDSATALDEVLDAVEGLLPPPGEPPNGEGEYAG